MYNIQGGQQTSSFAGFVNSAFMRARRGVCAACSMFTGVLRHGGLIGVSLFLKDNVAKLQHCRDHLQHACKDTISSISAELGNGTGREETHKLNHRKPFRAHLENSSSQTISSWEKLMMCMASSVSWKLSLSCWPGMVMLPFDKKR